MNEGLVNYKKGQGGFIAQPLSTSSIGNLANTARLPKAPDSAWRCEWY
jgi:DNA-binding GntR family transcriptional regulator